MGGTTRAAVAASQDVVWRESPRGGGADGGRRDSDGGIDEGLDGLGGGIEVAHLPDGGAAVRHSRHREGPVLVYTRAEIVAFLLGAKDGDFDDLLAEGA
jgi:Domain of unknown function (DUF397)